MSDNWKIRLGFVPFLALIGFLFACCLEGRAQNECGPLQVFYPHVIRDNAGVVHQIACYDPATSTIVWPAPGISVAPGSVPVNQFETPNGSYWIWWNCILNAAGSCPAANYNAFSFGPPASGGFFLEDVGPTTGNSTFLMDPSGSVAPGFYLNYNNGTTTNGSFNLTNNSSAKFGTGNAIIFNSTNQLTSFNGFPVKGTGVSTIVGGNNLRSQTAAISTTTIYTNTAATSVAVIISANVTCDTAVATATVALTVTYKDSSGTTETLTDTPANATCTTLGTNSVSTVGPILVRLAATTGIVQWSTTIANSPNYDASIAVEQMSFN